MTAKEYGSDQQHIWQATLGQESMSIDEEQS
jgi:hypothetical protein